MGKEYQCKIAAGNDLPAAVSIGLDEAFSALQESLAGLTDEQAAEFPIEGGNCIACIVMH